MLLEQLPVEVDRLAAVAEQLRALARLQQRGRLPAGISVERLPAEILADRLAIVSLVEPGFADHPLRHGGRFGLGAAGGGQGVAIGLAGRTQFAEARQATTAEVVDLLLLAEVGIVAADRVDDRQRLAPLFLLGAELCS